jgi:hypothetical protein
MNRDLSRCVSCPGELLLLWDRLPGHKVRLTQDFVAAQHGRLLTDCLPSYAPELHAGELSASPQRCAADPGRLHRRICDSWAPVQSSRSESSAGAGDEFCRLHRAAASSHLTSSHAVLVGLEVYIRTNAALIENRRIHDFA